MCISAAELFTMCFFDHGLIKSIICTTNVYCQETRIKCSNSFVNILDILPNKIKM